MKRKSPTAFHHHFARAAASTVLLVASAWPASGQTTWSGAGDGTSWGDGGNWSPGVPAAANLIYFKNLSADQVQTINLGSTRVLSGSMQIDSTGNRDYVISGGMLDLLRTTGNFRLVSGSGNTTLTIDSDIALSTTTSTAHQLEITGTGARTINLNGAITSGSGGGNRTVRLDAGSVRLNLRGDNSFLSSYLAQGEIVTYHQKALGNSQLQGGNASNTAILSLASDLDLGSTTTATFLIGNINVRIREDAPSSQDRIINFNTRVAASTNSGGENGKITVVENINSTGRVILNVANSAGTTVQNLPIDLGANGLLRFSNSASTIYGGAGNGSGIISGSGDVEMTGGGTTTLSALNSYSGTTTITAGTLVATDLTNGGVNSSIGSSGNAASNLVIAGGAFRYAGAGASTDRLFTLGAGNSALESSGSGALAFANTGAIAFTGSGPRNLTLSGSQAGGSLASVLGDGAGGATSLTKTGTANTWTLSALNSYTGATTITAGTLVVNTLANAGQNSGIGAASADAENLLFGAGTTATLHYVGEGSSTDRLFSISTGTATINSSGSGAVHFTNTGAMGFNPVGTSTRTLRLAGSNTGRNSIAMLIGNPTSGATSIQKQDAGTWVLSAANTYTGTTTISDGILSVNTLANGGAASGIGMSSAGATNLILGGGSLEYTGAGASTNRLFTLTENGGAIIANGSGAVTFAATGSATVNGVGDRTFTLSGTNTGNNTFALILGNAASGETSLVKSGGGTWVLNGASTFTGGTTVEEGVLRLNSSNRLSATGAITVNGGTLDLNGAGQTTSGEVTLDGGSITNGTLTLGAGNFQAKAGTLGARLAGSVGLLKTTSGTMTVSGEQSYTGATVVSSGALLVDGNIAASSGVTVAAGATLGGHGTVSGIGGEGTVSAGNSPGVLTADYVDGSNGLSFIFEFTTTAPDFSNAAASGNDLLRLTGATPFEFSLSAANTIVVDFSNATLNMGDVFQGGFYTDMGNFLGSIEAANFQFLGLGGYTVNLAMVQSEIDFGGGLVGGYITQFTVVPEPGSVALFGLAALGFGWMLRKRRGL